MASGVLFYHVAFNVNHLSGLSLSIYSPLHGLNARAVFLGRKSQAKGHLQARRDVRQGVPGQGTRGDPSEAGSTVGWRLLRASSTQSLLCHPDPGVYALFPSSFPTCS